ncbi:hypothetical protein [Paludibacterium yongneupense]|uniref:hypothetical protein n=1 Tax=Paludibacterium yongneupense TaxID=400061 RepID=UPI00042202A5|nr:hypothetical protein [Paludibacterium yongneupense]
MRIIVLDPGVVIDDSTIIGFGLDRSGLAAGEQQSATRLFMRYDGDIDIDRLAETTSGIERSVYGPAETLDALAAALPAAIRARLRFEAVEVGDTVALPDGMATALPADRGDEPAIGWLVEGPWRALAISGDDGQCAAFWHWASNAPSLTDVICPQITPDALALLPPNAHIWLPPNSAGSYPIAAIKAGMTLEL